MNDSARFQALHTDCLEGMRGMESETVDCCVTSPPYWGLRDYGVSDAIGLEPTLQEYLDRLAQVFAEVHRLLKPTGTLWLNMGDAYASDDKWGGATGGKHVSELHGESIGRRRRHTGLKSKDLIGLPWRVAFALQEQGWYLRSDIIWAKPNPMPESVRDRPTRAHEYVFLLTKAAKYWYDAEAIAEPVALSTIDRLNQPTLGDQAGSARANGGAKTNGNMKAVAPTWPERKAKGATAGNCGVSETYQNGVHGEGMSHYLGGHGGLRNSRTVWEISTQPYPDAHFATFPQELPRRCIAAGCPEGGLVLDPFAGSGTTLAAAVQLGRRAVGIEINADYVKLIERRMQTVTPSLFGTGEGG